MIFLQMALYCEAAPILRNGSFKALAPFGRFQRWQSEDMTLLLSGTGQQEAAACAAINCTAFEPSQSDLFVILGSCAGIGSGIETGRLYQVNALEDLGSGRVCYPDMLLDLGLPEARLLSGYQVLSQQKESVWFRTGRDPGDLYDMESAGAYAAASHFFGPHQILVLRMPTDSGGEDAENLTPELISGMMEKNLPELESVLDRLRAFSRMLEKHEGELAEEDRNALLQVGEALRCSASMRMKLEQLIRYAVSAGIPYREFFERCGMEGRLPVPGRKEGKDLLAEFEHELTC